jgi:serine/threonine-protein kinase
VQRDRRKRPADVAAIVFVLDHGADLARPPAPVGLTAAAARTARTRVVAVSIGAALAGIVAAFVAVSLLTPAAAPAPITRFAISPPSGQVFPGGNAIPRFAVSPDGRSVAFEAGPIGKGPFHIWVRRLDRLDAEPLRLTEAVQDGAIQGMFWFPDGRMIGYFDEPNGKVKKVDVETGAVQSLADVMSNQLAGSANEQGTVIYSSSGTKGILRIPSKGGTPAPVTNVSSERQEVSHLWPRFLPDGRHFVYLAVTKDRQQWAIYAGSLDGQEPALLVRADGMPEFTPPDQLLYVRGDSLFAQTMDMDAVRLVGELSLVLQPVFVTGQGRAGVSVSNTGVLVHAVGPGVAGGSGGAIRTLTWIGRDGREEPIEAPSRPYNYLRISPDGTRVALDSRDGDNDLWIWDFSRKTLTRLTFSPSSERSPVWTPDSNRIVFSSGLGGPGNLFYVAANGTGMPERLTETTDGQVPSSITPDGRQVLFNTSIRGADVDLMTVDLDPPHRVRTLLDSPGLQRTPMVSPDGRWLAYESIESGEAQIYVRPYPDIAAGRWQVSTNGGTRPLWARNGRELFYVAPDSGLMALSVEAGQSWIARGPVRLFTSTDLNVPILAGLTYDVSPDARRFLVLKRLRDDITDRTQLVVVQNWFEELKRLAPANQAASRN